MQTICFHNGILLTGTNIFQQGAILIEDNKIVDVFYESRLEKKKLSRNVILIDVKGAYIAPGFIDTHIHGMGGFGTDILGTENPDAIIKMSKVLPKYGVTSFCPTMYPQPIEQMNNKLTHIVHNIKMQENTPQKEKGANIVGIHMEGPFISTKRLGVHKPEVASLPSLSVMSKFIELGEGYITNMTVAPELKGMHEIAILASNNNIVLQAGHTNAEYENILEGIQVGILHSTHFFNAMSRLHHRNPGTVGAILIHPEMSCEVIADGIHVHPHLISLLLKNKSFEKLVLITDALTPTMQNSTPFYANKEEVILADGIFHTLKDNIIAGSALTMIQGIKNLVAWGIPIEQAVGMASLNPANIIGIPHKGKLVPGYDADITIFDQNMNILHTIIKGDIKYSKHNIL